MTYATKIMKASATAGFLALAMAVAPASAFVDPDHSAEGVRDSATMYKGAGSKSSFFVDYDHSAQSIKDNRKSNDKRTSGSCAFVDCDHAGGQS